MSRIIPIIFLLALSSACTLSPPDARPENWATEVVGADLNNFYKVSWDLYRSEQPGEKAFAQVEAAGIRSVLNLRGIQTDKAAVESTNLELHLVRMSPGSVSEDQVLEALKVIRDAKGPILVHCWHGSDRTGVVVAAYRMVFQDWSREEAIDELKHGGFGFHGYLYPNLVDLLEDLDIARLKSDLDL